MTDTMQGDTAHGEPVHNRTGQDQTGRPWRDAAVWAGVAEELTGFRARGLGGVLTEEVVRFCSVRAMVAAGLPTAGLRADIQHPVDRDLRIDLAIGAPKPTALVEWRYPREPLPAGSPLTDSLGQVLQDFYKLASHPGTVDRVLALAETERLRTYLDGVSRRHGLTLDAETVELRPGVVAGLRQTVRSRIHERFSGHRITARRLHLLPVDAGLRIAVYQVDPIDAGR